MKIKILIILIILVLTVLYFIGSRAKETVPTAGETIECLNNLCSSTSCRVDYSDFIGMESFARRVAKLCEENYPKIKQTLPGNEKLQPPYQIIFRQKQTNPGETWGSTIYLSSEWFTVHPDDLGAIIHEMAHVVQGYPAGPPFWLVEGMGDYVRYKLGYQNSWSYPHCGAGSESYNSGYWCGAAFLMFIEKNYDKGIIAELNTDSRENKYSDSLFQLYTGKTIESLWQECRQFDCVYIE